MLDYRRLTLGLLSLKHVEQLNSLIRQISPEAPERYVDDWTRIVQQRNVYVVVCVDTESEGILGMGAAIIVEIPTRTKAYIEDVAVDEQYRRRSIARSIEAMLMRIIGQHHAPVAYLTSSRASAEALWKNLGWQEGATKAFYKKT